MKRILIVFAILLLCVSGAYASTAQHVRSATSDSLDFALGAASTTYTKSMILRKIERVFRCSG